MRCNLLRLIACLSACMIVLSCASARDGDDGRNFLTDYFGLADAFEEFESAARKQQMLNDESGIDEDEEEERVVEDVDLPASEDAVEEEREKSGVEKLAPECLHGKECTMGHSSMEQPKIQFIPQRDDTIGITIKNLIFGPNYPHYFKLIDSFLMQNEKTEDVKANLKVARDRLRLMLTRKSVVKSALTKAFEHFVSLSELDDPSNRCTKRSYSILRKNDRGTPEKYDKRRQGMMRRVEKIFFHYAKEHSQYCINKYFKIWSVKKNKLDTEHMERLKVFATEMILQRQSVDQFSPSNGPSEKLSPSYVAFLIHLRSILGSKSEHSALTTITKQLAELPEKTVLTPELLKDEYTRYLLEPCGYYLREFESEFSMAENDLKFLNERSFDVVDDEDKEDFYFAWAQYRVCELLYKDKNTLFKNLLKHITKNGV